MLKFVLELLVFGACVVVGARQADGIPCMRDSAPRIL